MPQKNVFDRLFDVGPKPVKISDHPAAQMLLERRGTYRKFLKHCLPQLAKLGAHLKVRLDFVGSMEINAGATKHQDDYLIGINVGTFDRLARLYSTLLSWPEVLPEVGDPARENAGDFDVARCLALGWQPKGPRSRQGAESFRMPRDPVRRTASIAMNLMAMDFIFAHEFAHIYDAHVDFSLAQGAAQLLTEASPNGDAIASPVEHALEIEADMDAASMLGSGVLHGLLIYQDFSKAFDQPTFLLLWVFSILLLFHVFDLSGATVERYRNEKHPHPEIRLLFVLASLQAKARLGFGLNEQGIMTPVTVKRPDLEELILACRDLGIVSLDAAMKLLGLEQAVLPNERRNHAAFAKEGMRVNREVLQTLEPVRDFARARHLGVSFEVPFDWIRT